MKQRWGLILAVACISFFSGGWLLQRGVDNDGGVYKSARLFDDVLARVQAYYVDSIGEADLYQKATDGMLDELHDPYTVLLQGDNYKALTETTTGNYGGLGIQIDVRDGWITVVAPLPDTPAERAGIQTGDQIIAIDGKSTEGWNSDQAVKTLRGPAGSAVVLTVRRVGVPAPIEFKLTRAQIHNRSVALADAPAPHTGVHRAHHRQPGLDAVKCGQAIDSLRGAGATSLILDLRGNPGRVARRGRGRVRPLPRPGPGGRVHPRPRAAAPPSTYADSKPQAWPGMPIVVLVDVGSGQRGGDHRGRAAGPRPGAGGGRSRPSARGWCSRCSASTRPPRSSSPRRAGTRRAAARSSGPPRTSATRSCRRWRPPRTAASFPTRCCAPGATRSASPSSRPTTGASCSAAAGSCRT